MLKDLGDLRGDGDGLLGDGDALRGDRGGEGDGDFPGESGVGAPGAVAGAAGLR